MSNRFMNEIIYAFFSFANFLGFSIIKIMKKAEIIRTLVTPIIELS